MPPIARSTDPSNHSLVRYLPADLDTGEGLIRRYGIHHVGANLDSFEMTARFIEKQHRRRLRRQLASINGGKSNIERHPKEWWEPFRCWRVWASQPSPDTMDWFEYQQRKNRSEGPGRQWRTSRADWGTETGHNTKEQALAYQEHIRYRSRLKNVRCPHVMQVGEAPLVTFYWNDAEKDRNLALYICGEDGKHKPRTIEEAEHVVRAEVRLRSDALQQLKLTTIESITKADPAWVFDKVVAWVSTTARDRFVERDIANWARENPVSDRERERLTRLETFVFDFNSKNIRDRTNSGKGFLELVPASVAW